MPRAILLLLLLLTVAVRAEDLQLLPHPREVTVNGGFLEVDSVRILADHPEDAEAARETLALPESPGGVPLRLNLAYKIEFARETLRLSSLIRHTYTQCGLIYPLFSLQRR